MEMNVSEHIVPNVQLKNFFPIPKTDDCAAAGEDIGLSLEE